MCASSRVMFVREGRGGGRSREMSSGCRQGMGTINSAQAWDELSAFLAQVQHTGEKGLFSKRQIQLAQGSKLPGHPWARITWKFFQVSGLSNHKAAADLDVPRPKK